MRGFLRIGFYRQNGIFCFETFFCLKKCSFVCLKIGFFWEYKLLMLIERVFNAIYTAFIHLNNNSVEK